jgi:hypothetical protein
MRFRKYRAWTDRLFDRGKNRCGYDFPKSNNVGWERMLASDRAGRDHTADGRSFSYVTYRVLGAQVRHASRKGPYSTTADAGSDLAGFMAPLRQRKRPIRTSVPGTPAPTAPGTRPTTRAPRPPVGRHPRPGAAAWRRGDPWPRPVALPRRRAIPNAFRATAGDRRHADFRLQSRRTESSNPES